MVAKVLSLKYGHEYDSELYLSIDWSEPISEGETLWIDGGLATRVVSVNHYLRDPDYTPHVEYCLELTDTYVEEMFTSLEFDGKWLRDHPLQVRSKVH